MRVNLPDRVRVALYVITALGSPVIAVLTSADVSILPQWVATLWTAEVTAVTAMAALNVTVNDK
jgi:hypothetical protein